jgi:hypothetical protein
VESTAKTNQFDILRNLLQRLFATQYYGRLTDNKRSIYIGLITLALELESHAKVIGQN